MPHVKGEQKSPRMYIYILFRAKFSLIYLLHVCLCAALIKTRNGISNYSFHVIRLIFSLQYIYISRRCNIIIWLVFITLFLSHTSFNNIKTNYVISRFLITLAHMKLLYKTHTVTHQVSSPFNCFN